VARSLLLVCPSCERHVRVVDEACPFCGLALSAPLRASLALHPPRVRLGRAALYALGMGTLTLAPVACGGTVVEQSSEAGTGSGDSAPSDALPDQITIGPSYGHAMLVDVEVPDESFSDGGEPDASETGSSDAMEDIVVLPPYGAPSPEPSK
jgi:hypothetical protein